MLLLLARFYLFCITSATMIRELDSLELANRVALISRPLYGRAYICALSEPAKQCSFSVL